MLQNQLPGTCRIRHAEFQNSCQNTLALWFELWNALNEFIIMLPTFWRCFLAGLVFPAQSYQWNVLNRTGAAELQPIVLSVDFSWQWRKKKGIIFFPPSALLNMQVFECRFGCVWYLSWSCWTAIACNAEQSTLAGLDFHPGLYSSAVTSWQEAVIRMKSWSLLSASLLWKHVDCPSSVSLSFVFSHGLCESEERRDDHVVWFVLCLPADGPLPRGSEDRWGKDSNRSRLNSLSH